MVGLRVQKTQISQETLIYEMRKKYAWFDGHYILRNGVHTDVFIIPKQMNSVFSLRLKLMNVLLEIEYDSTNTNHLFLSKKSGRIIRSVHDVYKVRSSQFVYPTYAHGNMSLDQKLLAELKENPFIMMDDVVRQGKALKILVDLCEQHQLRPISIIAAINSGLQTIGDIPILSLVNHPIKHWAPDNCELCQAGNHPYDPYHFTRQV